MAKKIAGRTVLQTIDRKAKELREIVTHSTTQMANTSRHLAALTRKEVEIYQQLAALRLTSLAQGAADGELSAADRHAVSLLEKHENLLDELNAEISQLSQKLEELDVRRETQADHLADVTLTYDQAVEKIRHKLLESDAYKSQLQEAERLDLIAEHAIQKTQLAQTDRVQKGKPYENDPLFSYLWARDYGKSDYREKGIIKFLDEWVAKLCGFDKARRNYHMLLEIPQRLEEHAQQVEQSAEQAVERLEEMEATALLQDGIVSIKTQLDQAMAELQNIDQSIDDREQQHQEKLEAQMQAARGDDPYYTEALKQLVVALRRRDLRDLRALVQNTPLPEDDLLVEELFDIEEEERDIKKQTLKEQQVLGDFQDSLKILGDIRRRFKQHKYDSMYSEFKNWKRLDHLLDMAVKGGVSYKTLWKQIRRSHHMNRRDADFGGGNWSRDWGMPDPFGSTSSRHSNQKRNRRRYRSGADILGDVWSNGGFGGNWGSRRGGGRIGRPRTMPRFPKPRSGGGFKTGGGF